MQEYDENSLEGIPTQEEIADYANFLGIDPQRESQLLYDDRNALSNRWQAALPEEWKACAIEDPDGVEDRIYYFNTNTGESVWEHPCDEIYRSLAAEERNRLYGASSPSSDDRLDEARLTATAHGPRQRDRVEQDDPMGMEQALDRLWDQYAPQGKLSPAGFRELTGQLGWSLSLTEASEAYRDLSETGSGLTFELYRDWWLTLGRDPLGHGERVSHLLGWESPLGTPDPECNAGGLLRHQTSIPGRENFEEEAWLEEAVEEDIPVEEESQDQKELLRLLGAYEANYDHSSDLGSSQSFSPLASGQQGIRRASPRAVSRPVVACGVGGYWRMRIGAVVGEYRRQHPHTARAQQEGGGMLSDRVSQGCGSPRSGVTVPSWFLPTVPGKDGPSELAMWGRLHDTAKNEDIFEGDSVESDSSPGGSGEHVFGEEMMFQRMSPSSLRRELDAFHASEAAANGRE